MDLLKLSDNNIIKFNNEIYYKNDDEHTEGVLVYTHTGFTEADGGATLKYISITIATNGWVLTVQNISSGGGGGSSQKLYLHKIYYRNTSQSILTDKDGNTILKSIAIFLYNNDPTPFTYTTFFDYLKDHNFTSQSQPLCIFPINPYSGLKYIVTTIYLWVSQNIIKCKAWYFNLQNTTEGSQSMTANQINTLFDSDTVTEA